MCLWRGQTRREKREEVKKRDKKSRRGDEMREAGRGGTGDEDAGGDVGNVSLWTGQTRRERRRRGADLKMREEMEKRVRTEET